MTVIRRMEALAPYEQDIVASAFASDSTGTVYDNRRMIGLGGLTRAVCITKDRYLTWKAMQKNDGQPDSGMRRIELDMLTGAEVKEIRKHFAATSADYYIGTWSDISMYVSRKAFIEWTNRKKQVEDREKKTVTVKKATVDPPKAAPNCPRHSVPMRYHAVDKVFVCPEKDCEVKARPKTKKSDFKDVVINTEYELVKTPADKFYLLAVTDNVMIDINNIIEMTGTGRLHGSESEWTLMLKFPAIREVDEEVD